MLLVVVLAVMSVTPSKSQSITLPQLFKGEPTLQNQYGITSHITWHGYEYDDYRNNVDLIRQSGNNIIRTDFSAKNLGWDRGKADYTVWDNVCHEAEAAGLQFLPMIYCNPKSLSQTSNGSLKEFVTTCVSRYGNHVTGWEVGNELDLANAADGSIPPTEYLTILKDTYHAIKESNPDNLVLNGAIGSLDNNYLEELLAANAADFFDVLSIHFYNAYSIPETIIPFYQKLYSLLDKYHVDKPIWLTETGYRTYKGDADQDIFYTEILPQTYKQLGIDISKYSMGHLYDSRIPQDYRNQDNCNIYHGFKSCHLVKLDDLKDLSVKESPVLMILFREFFPKGYFEDLRSYIQKGGTVVFPEGGAVLFNELDLVTKELTPVGKKYYKSLHINYMFEWDTEAKRKKIQKITSIQSATDNTIHYAWHEEDLTGPRYLLSDNLENGDQMIPMVYGNDIQYKGAVAACYKLNSDLKGNIIIQTRPNHSTYVTEDLQASRLPRAYLLSYAMGVDKVFTYCLRDRSENRGYGIVKVNDYKKASFNTLETLASFLPSGSSRPVIKKYNNHYIASWELPNEKKVYCAWSSCVGQDNSIKVKGRAQFYDDKGKRISGRGFKVSPHLTYILGASSVDFE